MVRKIVLFDRLINITSEISEKEKKIIINKYNNYIKDFIKGLPNTRIKFKKLREYDKRIEFIITGPEESFIYNMLKKEIGTIHNFEELRVGNVIKGKMVEVKKVGFGIFVDCGIFNPNIDVLIPLHSLREQLSNGNRVPLIEIIKAYNFRQDFPVYVKLLEINKEKKKIRGKLNSNTLNLFKKITNENIEGIISIGTTKGQLKKALIRKGYLKNIIKIERFGFLDNIVLLKEGTTAPGVISKIGSNLRNCKLYALRPKRIRNLYNNTLNQI
ncbi:MAG: DUF2110 family protein [Promethearchaeota archaeon]